MTTSATTRSNTPADTLADARAMLAAAEADPAVARRLGHAYLTRVHAQIARVEATLAATEHALDAQKAEHAHVAEDAQHLVLVMQELRDAVLAIEPPVSGAIAERFGRGAKLDASRPGLVADQARGMGAAIDDHPEVVRAALIDAQHRHDLTHYVAALDEARTHHATLTSGRAQATTAKDFEHAQLRAAAHHIRLVARVLHRREPAKLVPFTSPVAHHRVEHRAPKAPPAAGTPSP